jgi:hypothetical protein
MVRTISFPGIPLSLHQAEVVEEVTPDVIPRGQQRATAGSLLKHHYTVQGPEDWEE